MILNVELATCWETVYLGDVLGYIGNGLTNKQNKVKDGYPVTRIETISDDYINTKKVGYVDALLTEKVEKYRLRYGDILISHINSDPQLGRSVIYKGMPELLLHGMNLLRMRADPEKLDPFFLDYIFRFYRNRGVFISIASRAVGQSSINQRRMTALTIPLPPLPEQRAVASVLGAIQEAKSARQKEIALERERKAALMEYLFSHGTKGEPRKQTEIGEIPESWEVLKLGQLCRVFSGHGFKTKDYTQEGIPLIKIGNLQDGEVVINPINDYMPEIWQQREQLQKFILKSKDILIALTGATTGKTAVVPPSLEGTFLNQRVGKIELISPNAEQDFILVVIKTRLFQEAIQQNTLRSAQGNISPSSIAQIPIPLPLPPEQRTIASVFQAIDGKTASLKEEAEHLDELFHAMLEELMTGKRSSVPLIDAELTN